MQVMIQGEKESISFENGHTSFCIDPAFFGLDKEDTDEDGMV